MFWTCTEERESEDQWRREVAARRSRGRAKRRYMDAVEGEEDAEDSGDRWGQIDRLTVLPSLKEKAKK